MNFYFEIIQNAEIYNSYLNPKSKDFYRFKTLYKIIKILNDKKAYEQNDILHSNFLFSSPLLNFHFYEERCKIRLIFQNFENLFLTGNI